MSRSATAPDLESRGPGASRTSVGPEIQVWKIEVDVY